MFGHNNWLKLAQALLNKILSPDEGSKNKGTTRTCVLTKQGDLQCGLLQELLSIGDFV